MNARQTLVGMTEPAWTGEENSNVSACQVRPISYLDAYIANPAQWFVHGCSSGVPVVQASVNPMVASGKIRVKDCATWTRGFEKNSQNGFPPKMVEPKN
jgi:hypothetical protein